MEVQHNRSCLTQRPEALSCQEWMEINSADNAGPYLGAAGARPGPGVPAGSDRARGWRDGCSGHCSVLWPLLLARDPHGENRRKSEQIISDLQLQYSLGLCFSPRCPWWLFLDTVLSQNSRECDHCRTVHGQCGHILPPAEAETTQFIKHQPGTSSRAAAPLPRLSRDPSGSAGSVGSVPRAVALGYPPLPAAA